MKRRTFAMMALAAMASPEAAQFGTPGDIAGAAKRRAERAARDEAERALAKALFPLEENGADIRRQAPLLDGIDFGAPKLMTKLARAADGAFRISPGFWRLEAQSFCLNAGTYERTGGAGYLSGALTGKVAPAIQMILQGAWRNPGVPQGDIQMLLWSVLSGVPVSQMNAKANAAARAILTAEQYAEIDGGALTHVPQTITGRARSALPNEARTALYHYERLRTVAARPSSAYADFEAVAILTGEPRRSRSDVPAGRWSWHPAGFHLRYFSDSYRRTVVEIVRGESHQTRRDALGRIVEIKFSDGAYSRATFRDDVEPLRSKTFKGLVAYAFKSVEIAARETIGGALKTERVLDRGYAFMVDRGARRTEARPLRYAMLDARDDGAIVLAQGGYDWGDAYERGRGAYDRYQDYRGHYEAATRPTSGEDIDNLFDEEHYRDGVEAATTGDAGDRLGWIADHHERQARALAEADGLLGALPTTSTTDDLPVYDPSGETGLPGASGVQRRGVSARSY